MDVVEVTPAELLGPLNEAEGRHAPPLLYAAGDLDMFRTAARVAIVGARVATEQGARRTGRLSRWLCARGAVVVSGLAQGIDTAAHVGALDVGGHTAAVLGTSLERAYPRENADLQRRLTREQLVLSQFPLGTKPMAEHLPERNRTMALVTDVTVIMEAGDRSLSLIQGWEALRLGRPLFVARSLTLNPGLAWPAAMMARGAKVLANETLADLHASLPDRGGGSGVGMDLMDDDEA